MHSSCHICWRTRGSGFSLCPVSLHRTPQTEALGLWPLSCLRKQQSAQNIDGFSANAQSLFWIQNDWFSTLYRIDFDPLLPSTSGVRDKCSVDLTFHMYVTSDQRTKHSSYPPGRAADSRQGELLSWFLHLDGGETPAVLSRAGTN